MPSGHISCYKIFTSVIYHFYFHNFFFTSAIFFLTSSFFLFPQYLLPQTLFFLTFGNFVFTSTNFCWLQSVESVSAIFYHKFTTLLRFSYHTISPNMGIYSRRFDRELKNPTNAPIPKIILSPTQWPNIKRDMPTPWLTFGCMRRNPTLYRCTILLLRRVNQLNISKQDYCLSN